MKDITPKAMSCAIQATCPAIFEITPEDLRCAAAMACPALFDHPDGYVIIGKLVTPEEVGLVSRVGPGEAVIVVPKALLSELPEAQACCATDA